ncbi:MAG: peptidylprolyl isomerase [Alphaproteobacteria bacterium]|nr:MAG: peptidylprolyl isomerase [Alphaproteobacteria bacterium]
MKKERQAGTRRRWAGCALVLLFLSVLSGGRVVAGADDGPAFDPADPENHLYIDLPCGRVDILMRPDKAPRHVERIKTLARRGFYDGLIFHRVIEGFMAQTGDPTGTGRGGSDLPDLKAEFNDLPHLRGTVSMARAADPDSANSQFFIMFTRVSSLDGRYTVWGRVVRGMDCVDKIARGEPPANPTRIIRVRVAADLPPEERTKP